MQARTIPKIAPALNLSLSAFSSSGLNFSSTYVTYTLKFVNKYGKVTVDFITDTIHLS